MAESTDSDASAFSGSQGSLPPAPRVELALSLQALDHHTRTSERGLELREFTGPAPVMELHLRPETGSEPAGAADVMEILMSPHPPQKAKPWLGLPRGFPAAPAELGDLARLDFATTGFAYSDGPVSAAASRRDRADRRPGNSTSSSRGRSRSVHRACGAESAPEPLTRGACAARAGHRPNWSPKPCRLRFTAWPPLAGNWHRRSLPPSPRLPTYKFPLPPLCRCGRPSFLVRPRHQPALRKPRPHRLKPNKSNPNQFNPGRCSQRPHNPSRKNVSDRR